MYQGEVYLDTGVSQRIKAAISASFERIKQPDDVHTPLCQIMRKSKSDKGFGPHGKHNYTQFYYEIFAPVVDKVESFLEIGLGTNNLDVPSNMGAGGTPGASLRGWRSFFENANIYGGDVDKRILFEEERIKTFYIDQLDPVVIAAAMDGLELEKFDVILDDGLHRYQANRNFHEKAQQHVKEGGVFIIEDINCTPENVALFKDYLGSLHRPAVFINFPHQRVIPDNCLVLIEY